MTILKSVVSATRSVGGARASEVAHYVVAAAWLFAIVAASAWAATTLPLTEIEMMALLVGAIIVAAVGVTLFSSLAELYGQHARDLSAQALFEALSRGEKVRPYALYLRPFAATDVIAETVSSGALFGAGALAGERIELETQIERAIRPIGPLVALGAPLEHIGAGRIRVPDATWREAIGLLLKDAQIILMLPSSRAGTLEEIGMILSTDMIRRTVLIDPPNLGGKKRFDQSAEWAGVQAAFQQHKFELPGDARNGMLLFYGDDRKPLLKERLDIDADDRIERLFRRIARMRRQAAALSGGDAA